jgi:hypothetical protein
MTKTLSLLLSAACAWGASDLAVYRLLAPSAHSFELSYDTAVSKPGATYFFNPVRPGSIVAKESAIDLATGKPLELKTATAKDAIAAGMLAADTPPGAEFVWVKLLHPVVKGSETRIRVLRTYVDAASYKETITGFVFDRPLTAPRNMVILPAGFELVDSRSPGIVTTDAEGRIHISFFNDREDQLPVHVVGRRLP